MNKRKIQINQLKKAVCKGKKVKTINVKYETVLSFFKQKESKDLHVFNVTFMPLINDILNHLSATEIVDKLQSQSKQPIKKLPNVTTVLKLETFELKALSNQYPIHELCSCLYIQGHDKRVLSIHKSKLMSFFKHLRTIYADFCYCAGEKIIIESSELKVLYDIFIGNWNKNEEKGRISAIQKIQRRLCRSLYFLGILIQNNILQAIQSAERRKKEQDSDLGTKSEHKKTLKGVNQQVSTVHSIASLDPSNLSARLKSQNSQQQIFPIRNNLSSQYSQKSQKVISKSRFNLWDKAEIKNLKFALGNEPYVENAEMEVQKYEINYLSNDVENILIQQAFKMQKFTDSCYRNESFTPYQYYMVDNSGSHSQLQYANYYMGSNYMQYYNEIGQHHYNYPQQYLSAYDYHAEDSADLNQLKRSLNLVQTRKKDKDRYQ